MKNDIVNQMTKFTKEDFAARFAPLEQKRATPLKIGIVSDTHGSAFAVERAMEKLNGVDALLHLVGLEKTAKKKARNFSLGMRQRLGIAVALAGEPDFLLLDEPVNGLDPQGIVEMRELILRLNREQGITVLISSHILDELSRLATWYGFIDGGRMVKEISAEALENECRKCIRAEVSDAGALARVLDGAGIEYKILSDKTADIFGETSVTALAEALRKENCELYSMKERDESLESYYMSLVGGDRRA